MQETTVARSYAEALFELASTDDAIQTYLDCITRVADLVRDEPDFRTFLETPRIESSDKKRVIRDVFGEAYPERLLRFLLLLIDKRRQRLLPNIVREFELIVNEHLGRLQVEITTATEPDELLRESLTRRLSELLDREILPRYRLEPRIIGGVIVKVGDRIMDGSVRRRLQRMRHSLLATEVS